MPRENRKRGKKHKKVADEYPQNPPRDEEPQEEPQADPSWIVSAPQTAEFNEEAPFGYVDSEVKAYFRTVDVQIREWQEEPSQASDTQDGDPNEGLQAVSSHVSCHSLRLSQIAVFFLWLR